uniref:signal-regulatory protein beta-2-like n=1 Tax=Semicossyphus pulcher TaxID=241346 RepID=UPI0037E99ACF
MKLHTEATISEAYKERFQVLAQGQSGINHLVIKDVHLSDSATYYCGILEFNEIEFGKGVFLHVKNSSSNIQAIVHQPALEQLQRGDSVNLSCTAYAETCAGERSFYWFRHGAAQPAIIYHSAGLCMTDSESHMKNCTLNLALNSVSSSDAGMYYCALASCGEIVFGQGTRVEIAGSAKVPRLLVHCLSVALAVSIIVLLILAFITYKLKNKLCSICKGTVSHLTGYAASELLSQDADILHYAALSVNRTSERHRQEDSMESDCVYSRVKSRKE